MKQYYVNYNLISDRRIKSPKISLFNFKYWIVCVLVFKICSISIAQNFSYSFTKDSSSYNSISNPTVLVANETWVNKRFKVNIPFEFNFCGFSSDSIIIENNGFLILNNNLQLAIVAFNNFSGNKDTNNNYTASIGYSIDGSDGNRILKIEYKNLSQAKLSDVDNLNYQLWLYESNNKIEIHIGGNSYGTLDGTLQPVLLGCINRNGNSDPKGFLVKGSQLDYSAETISVSNDLIYLDNVPFEGVVLRLTPTF